MSQTAYVGCIMEQRVPFESCRPSSLERQLSDRVGIVGQVAGQKPGAYNKQGVLLDVQQASVDNVPHQIEVDYDYCLVWDPHVGDKIDIYIWRRASPNTGAYTLASCPERK